MGLGGVRAREGDGITLDAQMQGIKDWKEAKSLKGSKPGIPIYIKATGSHRMFSLFG